MTPQEIFEYKLKWAPGYIVSIHSDLDWEAKKWCRAHLGQWQWVHESYTDVYEHTYRFEHQYHADEFVNQFKNWITK